MSLTGLAIYGRTAASTAATATVVAEATQDHTRSTSVVVVWVVIVVDTQGPNPYCHQGGFGVLSVLFLLFGFIIILFDYFSWWRPVQVLSEVASGTQAGTGPVCQVVASLGPEVLQSLLL